MEVLILSEEKRDKKKERKEKEAKGRNLID